MRINKWNALTISILICALIVIIIIAPTFIINNIKKSKENIVYDKYLSEIKTKKIYFFSEIVSAIIKSKESDNYSISINNDENIDYDKNIKIKVALNENIKKENIGVTINGNNYTMNTSTEEFKIDGNDGKNTVNVKIKDNNELILEMQKKIYIINPYQRQYLDEISKSGTQVHYRLGNFESVDKDIKILESLGAKNVRAEFYVDQLSKNNFEKYDIWVNELKNRKINIFALIDSYPKNDNNKKIDSTEEIKEYINGVKKFHKRYNWINNIEIYNELNQESSYKRALLNEKDINWYMILGKELSEDKELYGINFIANGTSTPDEDTADRITSTNFYSILYRLGGMNYFSGMSYHPYATSLNNFRIKNIDHNKMINDNGGFTKVYITEYGNTTYNSNEDKQAKDNVIESIELDKDVKIKFLYNLWTTAEDNSFEQFGLLTHDYLPKKSYYSMKNYYQNTNGSEYIGQIKLIDGLEAHVYDKDGKPKIIAWATDSSKPITINYDGFTATDLYGNAIENTNGKIEITDSPVYLDNVSTNYFYQAISNSITEGYSDFNSKFKDEISKVNGLSNKINSLNQTASSLKNMSTLDENTANNLMKSHFELGNDLINAYNNGSLNVEYVKLSSMLDSLNTIGNSYEDLVTVSAKTRMNDLTDITNEVNNANSIIENNGKLDIVYPEKIYKFSKDLLDTSSYVLGLEEENDIKTGLINSKALHAKYLANWSQEFSQSYINDKLKKPINKIIADNEVIINNTSNGISKNSDILNSYATLKNNLNNLIKNETENNLDKLNNAYTNQMSLIKLVVSKYNSNEIRINDNIYKLMIENFINLSDDYKELYELYKTDSDIISTKEVEETLNKVINRYNDNKDSTNDFSNETDIINNMTELFNGLFDRTQDSVIEVQSAENYLKKQRILKTCDIASSMLENDIKQKADVEYKAITISSDKGINNFTNQDETITINLPKNAQITSESSNGFKFNDNGTKDVKLSIRGYDYTYTIKVNNIDKTLPKVTAQNGQSIKINAIDDNLKEIKIEKDGKETAVNNGQTITTPGIYKIIATDKAGNSANETAIVYGTYTNEQNSQVNYVTIKSKTKVRDIKQDGDYTIKDNNNIANEIKRAPSSVNTNAEKDSNSYIATGDILQDNNNTYIVITLGDLSGNGDVGVADIIKLRKSLVGLTKLTKLQELAADTNQNGRVNVSDLLKERKIMVGME